MAYSVERSNCSPNYHRNGLPLSLYQAGWQGHDGFCTPPLLDAMQGFAHPLVCGALW